jgi:hypothetical protein
MTHHEFPVWPRPQQIRFTGGRLSLSSPLRVKTLGRAPWLAQAAAGAAMLVDRAAGRKITGASGARALTIADLDALPPAEKRRLAGHAEGYHLSVAPRGAFLAAADARGAYYGAVTLANMIERAEAGGVSCAEIRDWPRFPVRGSHVYMPGRKNLDFFIRYLDFLASYKFNTLYLEIGGGMEYERHPEINAAWSKFCREAWRYDPRKDRKNRRSLRKEPHPSHPIGPNALQSACWFSKDSTHTELGEGGCLTRSEVARIVDACAARHIEIVPEVQSLSHSYYLCTAHPEIAERGDDPWPDTYCPSNPKSYELLFDVMEEVIDAFHPKMISIGHDEAYTFCICPRCKKRDAAEILSYDVNKIHGFLAARGIKTAMWGDKIMRVKYGGLARSKVEKGTGRKWTLPATWPAVSSMPKDLLIMDWYWGIKKDSERYFGKNGFDVMYGNFETFSFADWEKRSASKNVLGAEISTWCEVSAEAFGHNRIYTDCFAAADLLWNGRCLPHRQLSAVMARRTPAMIDALVGAKRLVVSRPGLRTAPVDIGPAASALPAPLRGKLRTGARPTTLLGAGEFHVDADRGGFIEKAVVLSSARPRPVRIQVGRKALGLLFLHGTTMETAMLNLTFNMYHQQPAELARYRVRYADGKTADVSALFGRHIGIIREYWPRPMINWMYQTCFQSVIVDAGEDAKLFVQEWLNPRPGVEIESVDIRLGIGATKTGEVVIPAISAIIQGIDRQGVKRSVSSAKMSVGKEAKSARRGKGLTYIDQSAK